MEDGKTLSVSNGNVVRKTRREQPLQLTRRGCFYVQVIFKKIRFIYSMAEKPRFAFVQ